MQTLEALAFITIYYIFMLLFCYVYYTSRFYKEERIFISYDTNYTHDYYNNNTKKMTWRRT